MFSRINYELSLVSLILYGKLSGGSDSRGTLAENVWRKIYTTKGRDRFH